LKTASNNVKTQENSAIHLKSSVSWHKAHMVNKMLDD